MRQRNASCMQRTLGASLGHSAIHETSGAMRISLPAALAQVALLFTTLAVAEHHGESLLAAFPLFTTPCSSSVPPPSGHLCS